MGSSDPRGAGQDDTDDALATPSRVAGPEPARLMATFKRREHHEFCAMFVRVKPGSMTDTRILRDRANLPP